MGFLKTSLCLITVSFNLALMLSCDIVEPSVVLSVIFTEVGVSFLRGEGCQVVDSMRLSRSCLMLFVGSVLSKGFALGCNLGFDRQPESVTFCSDPPNIENIESSAAIVRLRFSKSILGHLFY